MLNNYMHTLWNEIVTNFGIYDGQSDFRFIFVMKSDKELGLDYPSIYERMFGDKKHSERYAVAALERFYGKTTPEVVEALRQIIAGDFSGIKNRDENAIKVLRIIAEIVNIVNMGGSRQVILSVRDAEEEFEGIRVILEKLTGAFAKEDSDRFKVISKIHEYFKTRRNKAFNSIVDLYSKLSEKEIDYKSAISKDKKLTNQLIKMFNDNESTYVEMINEFSSLGVNLNIDSLKEALTDQVSDSEIESYKRTIQFYAKHLDALVELAKYDLNSIATDYAAIDDDSITQMKESVKSTFGEGSLIQEKLVGSNSYMYVVSIRGRYEPILKFIDEHEIRVFTLLMLVPKVENPITSSPSLRFLITSLCDDVDTAIDEFGKKPSIEVKRIGDENAVYLIGTQQNDKKGRENALALYLSMLAVEHGFDAKKLPFVQKFAN